MTNLRPLFFAIYIPSFLISVVQGAVILLIPLFALEQDASWFEAGYLFALKNVGILLSSLPAGIAVARIGEKKVMLLGCGMMAFACSIIALWHSLLGLSLSLLIFGLGCGLWTLARQSFLTGYCQPSERGRVMSTIAALQRSGTFLGPLVGGILCQYYNFELVFIFATLLVSASILLLVISRVVLKNSGKVQSFKNILLNLPRFVRQHQTAFLSSVLFVAMLKLVRGGRQLLLPLWGHHIGLSIAEISFACALSAFVDVALIYSGGNIADKYGRKWSGGLCLTVLSFALLLLPLSHDYILFTVVALFAGIGSGIGGGIIMVLGADLAPKENRGVFLGVWRLISDISGALSPVLIGGLGTLLSLGLASSLCGGFGLLGVGGLLFWTKETLIQSETRD